jgi:hypothetical protein
MAISNSIYTTNLSFHTGTDFVQIFTLADDGGAFNLNGYSAISKFKKNPASSTSTSFSTSITDTENGKIRISLTAAQTAELKAGRYYYDLYLHKDGENTRIIEGDVIIKKSVTRD